LLLAVDDGTLKREEGDAVGAVEPLALREDARHFLFFSEKSEKLELL
jgi:hypothetical protein